MSDDGLAVRAAERRDVAAVLELWSAGRSAHASLPDSAAALERLLADRPGAHHRARRAR